MTLKVKRVVCNGVGINYQVFGAGPDVVLIHGLATNHSFWRLDLLLALAKKYRVTVYDLRGHGLSEMPGQGYTTAEMAEDLHQLLNYLDISKCHLLGHSLGGVIALHYAFLHSERINSLIIADARLRALQPVSYTRNWPNREEAKATLDKIGIDIPENEPESGLWLLEQMALPKWQDKRHELKDSSLYLPFAGWNGGRKNAKQWLELLNITTIKQDLKTDKSFTADMLSAIQQQPFFMYGEKSHTLPSLEELQKRMPGSETFIFSGAGHFFPLSRPVMFINTVKKFLEKQ